MKFYSETFPGIIRLVKLSLLLELLEASRKRGGVKKVEEWKGEKHQPSHRESWVLEDRI